MVQRLKPMVKTSSGIYIPEKNQEKLNEGTVVSVGPGIIGVDNKLIPNPFKIGENVLFSQHAGVNLKIEGDDYLMLSNRDVLAKIVV